MIWNTRFTQLFHCRLPIMGAPMALVSGGRLAAATCNAGALGFLAAGHVSSMDDLEKEITIFRNASNKDAPLCIGFLSFSALKNKEQWAKVEYVLSHHRPAVVQFHAPAIVNAPGDYSDPQTNVELAHRYQAKVIAQVGSVAEAVTAVNAGVDALIAQGSEGGGHGLRRELGNSTLSLARQLVRMSQRDKWNIPILAAGGIVDGAGVTAALALGCDGAVLGTRLWASHEALGHDTYKQRLVDTASCDDVIRTTVFDQIMNSFSANPWPEPYDSLGVIRNQTSQDWDGLPRQALASALESGVASDSNSSDLVGKYREAQKNGDPLVAAVLAGQGVGIIDSLEPAFDIVTRIDQEAQESVRLMQNLLLAT